jgi:3-hydroxymyristoyl/3-hydroxydecanoyl-(acyl carrier protein) dehydratase
MDLTIMHRSPSQVTAQLSFSAHDPWVREHFPGAPVLPGSLALAAVLYLAEHLAAQTWTVRRLRCHAPVPPGTYRLCVTQHQGGVRGMLVDAHETPLVSAELVP